MISKPRRCIHNPAAQRTENVKEEVATSPANKQTIHTTQPTAHMTFCLFIHLTISTTITLRVKWTTYVRPPFNTRKKRHQAIRRPEILGQPRGRPTSNWKQRKKKRKKNFLTSSPNSVPHTVYTQFLNPKNSYLFFFFKYLSSKLPPIFKSDQRLTV